MEEFKLYKEKQQEELEKKGREQKQKMGQLLQEFEGINGKLG